MSFRMFRSTTSIGRQLFKVSDIACGMLEHLAYSSTLLAMLHLIRPFDLYFAENAALCSSLPYNQPLLAEAFIRREYCKGQY